MALYVAKGFCNTRCQTVLPLVFFISLLYSDMMKVSRPLKEQNYPVLKITVYRIHINVESYDHFLKRLSHEIEMGLNSHDWIVLCLFVGRILFLSLYFVCTCYNL